MKLACALYGLALGVGAAGCSNSNPAAVNTLSATKSAPISVVQPFRFHKRVEVAPGMDYDVLSWGRGSDSTGAYIILRSDSADKHYTTTTGDLDGAIKDVFNSDLDSDGNPEIFIQSQTKDSTRYGKIDAYEFNDNSARKLEFPKLTTRQKKGYHGGDVFITREDKLIRTYPVYDSDNRSAKLTGEKRTLAYSYHGNSFSVKQLSTDSTVSQSTATVNTEPVKAALAPAQTRSSSNEHSSRSHRQESRSRVSRHHTESKRRTAAHHRESNHRRRRHRG